MDDKHQPETTEPYCSDPAGCEWPGGCSNACRVPPARQPESTDEELPEGFDDLVQDDKYAVLGGALDLLLNGERGGQDRKIGFCLMIYPFGDHSGGCTYVSNGADRRDVVTLMKEMIARFGGQPEQRGRA